jgi:hypothetical protein
MFHVEHFRVVIQILEALVARRPTGDEMATRRESNDRDSTWSEKLVGFCGSVPRGTLCNFLLRTFHEAL